MMSYVLEACGYVDRTQYNAAIYENDKLSREIRNLRLKNKDLAALNQVITEELKILDDENKSLWDMLEELKASETFGKDQMKSMMDDLSDILTDEMLKGLKPIGEA
tara:strand:+ start:558 stop:875 length:318 start_codon:yes stop_codon:yes gene_type:complete